MTAVLLVVACLLFAAGAWILVRRRDFVVMAAGLWAMNSAGFVAYAAVGGNGAGGLASLALMIVALGQPVVALAAALAHFRVRQTVHSGDESGGNG